MKRIGMLLILLTVVAVFEGLTDAGQMAAPGGVAPETARYLAAMLVSGRDVVAHSQDLINDPDIGYKGFTAEYLQQKMIQDFERTTKQELRRLDPSTQAALTALIEAARQTVTEHQEKINQKGVGFKGFFPAYFGRLTAKRFEEATGIRIKQTTEAPRNPSNAPDTFELAVLGMYASGKIAAHTGYGRAEGPVYRYMFPVYMKTACLKCHGMPKGETDITGHLKEGYQRGELRGAISVSVPMAP